MDKDEAPLVTGMVAPRRLPLGRRFAYGVGHVLNDLCASMWFSYLLLYFHKVLLFTNSMAGGLLLLGQISDGICTPLIGYESDHTRSGLCNYGKRKSWHLVGTLCVICSFTFIYQPVFGVAKAEDWARFIYYAPFIVIFQFGWAATQISHLSLIPEISHDDSERVELNAIRYAFTVMSSIFVYGVTFVLLRFHDDSSSMAVDDTLDTDDVPQFRYLVLIVVTVGAVFSLIFHVGTREPKRVKRRLMGEEEEEEEEVARHDGNIQAADERPKVTMKWSDWLKEPQFYQVTFLYMFTRLMVNIAQIYIPMYVTDTLNMDKTAIALVPLVVYISGFLSTLVAKPINRKAGRKFTYFLGAVVYLGACIWMAVPNINLQVYGAAILLGAGSSTVLVTSLAFTADLIGRNTESGAFVYGAMSLSDKVSNGVAVEIIQLMQPCVHCCPGCSGFYKAVVTYVTGGAAIGALIVLATLAPLTIGKRRKQLPSVATSCVDPVPGCPPGGPGATTKAECTPHRELGPCADIQVHPNANGHPEPTNHPDHLQDHLPSHLSPSYLPDDCTDRLSGDEADRGSHDELPREQNGIAVRT